MPTSRGHCYKNGGIAGFLAHSRAFVDALANTCTPVHGVHVHKQLEQPAAERYSLVGGEQDDRTVFIGETKGEDFGLEFADLPYREIHDCGDHSPDKFLHRIMFGDLCR